MTATELWYFRPDPEITEVLEWSTEVLRCRAATQRIAHRQYPRIILRHKYVMTRADARRAELLARNQKTVLVPLWQDAARTTHAGDGVGNVTIGQTEFGQETNVGKRFRVADLVAVIGDDGTHETLTVQVISWINSFAEVQTLTGATQNHARALLMPVVEAQVAFRVTRVSGDYALARAEFLSTQPTEVTQNFPNAVIASYRDADLMTFRPLAEFDSEEGREWLDVDGGSGTIVRTAGFDYLANSATLRWYLDRWDTVGRGRWWCYQLQGRRRQFWVPTFNHDFQPVAAGVLSGTTLTVADFGFADVFDPEAPGGTHLAIYGDDELWYPREITAAATITPGVSESVTVDVALPGVVPVMISQLRAVRMASDRVEWRYAGPGFGAHPFDPILGVAVLSIGITEEVANEYVVEA